jgi:hypothetical protein
MEAVVSSGFPWTAVFAMATKSARTSQIILQITEMQPQPAGNIIGEQRQKLEWDSPHFQASKAKTRMRLSSKARMRLSPCTKVFHQPPMKKSEWQIETISPQARRYLSSIRQISPSSLLKSITPMLKIVDSHSVQSQCFHHKTWWASDDIKNWVQRLHPLHVSTSTSHNPGWSVSLSYPSKQSPNCKSEAECLRQFRWLQDVSNPLLTAKT